MIKKIKNLIELDFPLSINPENIIQEKIEIKSKSINIDEETIKLRKNTYIISIGKVAIKFAQSISHKLNHKKIIIITDEKYTKEEDIKNNQDKEILISTHPYLSQNSISNTEKIINFLKCIDSEDTTIIFLISGGASSMFEYPIINPNLAIEIYKYLLKQELDIYQINTVRRFFSYVKGGKILQYINKSQIISLIFSDVPSNDLATIASGITFLKKQNIEEIQTVAEILKPLIDHYTIHQTMRTNFDIYQKIETNNKNIQDIHHFILADNLLATKKLQKILKENKFQVINVSCHLKLKHHDLVNLFKWCILSNLENEPNLVLLFGGETSIKIEKEGYGGRLQHLVLEILREIKNLENIIPQKLLKNKEIIFFAFATDGIDGNTNKSGAIISNKINISIDKIEKYLANFNSGLFFENPKNQNYVICIPPGINNLNEIYGVCISSGS